ncbi:beta-1,3-galactosyltransferase 4 [Xenopus laevis]|uniref:Hexosyltransferase n=2 Tax=Xenopus laevis TaxID=8355 RepID=A0A1L8F8A2_XENLA|nr:beta-1,3-galactosyltransferase 4 [Xenopus laevis]XP_018085611.1 beta-1,3-galactosyltransferase 4 [Xenopus laevis]OCT67823.1 hypothetical protein XELAEV_18039127mg [Xenopus laevis]
MFLRIALNVHRLCIPRRRLFLLFLCLSLFILTLLFFSGHHEEIISYALPLFYPTRSPLSATPFKPPAILLSPAKACSPPPLLLILVSSSTLHHEQRNAIRQTWGSSSNLGSSVVTLFVLGLPQSQNDQAALFQEAKIHGDIIQAAFTDSYRNLTLKTLVGLSWMSQSCHGAKFLMKTDDDVFVNTFSMSRYLQGQHGPLFLGRMHWNVYPDRNHDSRHYISTDVFTENYFPPYCSGTGYILSHEVVESLLQQTGKGPILSLEDAYVGILAWAAGISPKHSARLSGSMRIPHNGCCYSTMFTSHGVTPKAMKEAWKMLSEARNDWCPFALLRCKVLGNLVENGQFGQI